MSVSELGFHGVKIYTADARFIVWIVVHGEAGRFKEGAVILPAWIADVDAGAGQQALEVISTKLECPRAAQRFNCNNAPFVQNLRVLPNKSVWTDWL